MQPFFIVVLDMPDDVLKTLFKLGVILYNKSLLSGYMSNKDNWLWLGTSDFVAFSSANA